MVDITAICPQSMKGKQRKQGHSESKSGVPLIAKVKALL